jgi:hypothetical protein
MKLLIAIFITTASFAQDRYHAPGIYDVKSIPRAAQVSITPQQLRNLLLSKEYESEIPDSLWKRLGVGPAEFGYCRLCEAELKFGRSGGGLAVLRLHTFAEYSRFFVLEQRPDWRITGYIDLTQQFEAPPFSIIETSTYRWLAIDAMTDHGSGIGSSSMNWFEIDGGIKHVLAYPAGAYLGVGWFSIGGDRTVRSHVVSFARDGSEELLAIRFEAKFEEVDRGLLFKIERNAVYSRMKSSEFRFDAERSKMSMEEFQTLFDNLTPRFSIEIFLKACLEPLKTVAASQDRQKRLWLRRFLQSAPASSTEKQLLLEILNK